MKLLMAGVIGDHIQLRKFQAVVFVQVIDYVPNPADCAIGPTYGAVSLKTSPKLVLSYHESHIEGIAHLL